MDTPIERRGLLTGIGTGLLAGCLSDSTETGTPSATESDGTATPVQSTEDDDTSTPTETPTETPSQPVDESVTLTATVIDSFTAAHPGRLRLTLTNQTEGLFLSLGVRRGIDGPLTVIRGSRDDGRELLLFYRGKDLDRYALCAESSETPIPEERVDGCWQPRCTTGLEVMSTHGSVVLGPGETLTGEYTLLDGFDDGCLRAGTYAFSDDASEIGAGEQTDRGVEFTSDPTRVVRHLDITLDEDGSVAASAEAVVGTNDASGSPSTPADTPGSVPRNSTSE
jgi:hypothetical protein